MKRIILCGLIGVVAGLSVADTTTDPVQHHAYGANIGWLNAAGDGAHGLTVAQNVCAGYMFSPGIGWISMGSGVPTNGIHYGNNHPDDYGVNRGEAGDLNGYAYSANTGWLLFEQTHGKPKVDPFTGQLSGYAWSGNLGWLSLSNAYGSVRVLAVLPGTDGDGDSLPDWWEYRFYGGTNASESEADLDSDGDGLLNGSEWLAGTDPSDPASTLELGQFAAPTNAPNQVILSWPSSSGRRYSLKTASTLNSGWTTLASGLEANPPMNSYTVNVASVMGYWRVTVE